MSTKIVGWLVGAWDSKFSDFTKSERKRKKSEINLKKENPIFLPIEYIYLLCTPPSQRPGAAVGGERQGEGGGIVFFLLIHYLHI